MRFLLTNECWVNMFLVIMLTSLLKVSLLCWGPILSPSSSVVYGGKFLTYINIMFWYDWRGVCIYCYYLLPVSGDSHGPCQWDSIAGWLRSGLIWWSSDFLPTRSQDWTEYLLLNPCLAWISITGAGCIYFFAYVFSSSGSCILFADKVPFRCCFFASPDLMIDVCLCLVGFFLLNFKVLVFVF